MIEMAINDAKWVEPPSLIYSLRTAVNKQLVWRPEEGWLLFIFVTLRACDETWTAEKKYPLCTCLKQAGVRRTKADRFILRRDSISLLADKCESASAEEKL